MTEEAQPQVQAPAPAPEQPQSGVEQHLSTLDQIYNAIESEFGATDNGPAPDKLAILEAHMRTVKMLVEQLYEERARG